jgi:hypothetical protein
MRCLQRSTSIWRLLMSVTHWAFIWVLLFAPLYHMVLHALYSAARPYRFGIMRSFTCLPITTMPATCRLMHRSLHVFYLEPARASRHVTHQTCQLANNARLFRFRSSNRDERPPLADQTLVVWHSDVCFSLLLRAVSRRFLGRRAHATTPISHWTDCGNVDRTLK